MRSVIFGVLATTLIGGHSLAHEVDVAPLKIPGARVPTDADASALALAAYIKKMNPEPGYSATEGVREVSIQKLGFDVPGFAKKGDSIFGGGPLWYSIQGTARYSMGSFQLGRYRLFVWSVET